MSTSQALLALVDCNNFYVSCERVFRPDLMGQPVAVLSNNDGCIVARSPEVKALGIKMGQPVFQVRSLVNKHKIHLFSSNYPLYADMSARVMAILEEFAPHLEIYSIDEAFLDLSGICAHDAIGYGQLIKKTVLKNTGIPVCVGLAPTKTLAKLANYAAKKWPQTQGVVDLSDPIRREKLMKLVPVNEVWGIGSRTAKKLNQLGVHTVWELANQSSPHIQAQFNCVVVRIVKELNGIACLELEEIAPNKQQIVCSRSFGRRLTSYQELSQAVAEFSSRASEKLRRQQSIARCISVFIRTNPFNPQEPQYQCSASHKLVSGSQDTRRMIGIAKLLLQDIYKPGYGYHKCGIQLSDIHPAGQLRQADLFALSKCNRPDENPVLMQTLDKINRRYPKGIAVSSVGFDKSWLAKADRRSQGYTTRWQELVTVKA